MLSTYLQEVSTTHPKQELLEEKLSSLCSSLDSYLENNYKGSFSLHPNRLRHGEGSNPSFDGLFSTSIAFTLGYGSKYGRGYLVNIDVRSLDFVPASVKDKITNEAYMYINENLVSYFPDRKLEIVKDGKLLKIIGDFSLGMLWFGSIYEVEVKTKYSRRRFKAPKKV